MKIFECTICLFLSMLLHTVVQAQTEEVLSAKSNGAKTMTLGNQAPSPSGAISTGIEESNRYKEMVALTPKVQISRWVSPVTGDFTSIPNNKSTDAQLPNFGYKNKMFQYEAYNIKPYGTGAIAVYRWIMPNCKEFILVGEHEYTDAQMIAKGYSGKELVFYAYQTDPGDGRHVKVSKWMNTATNGCKDYTLSVTELEYPGYSLSDFGYTNKTTQFYVPLPSAGLKTNFQALSEGTQFYIEVLNAPANIQIDIAVTGLPHRKLRKFTVTTDATGKAVISEKVFFDFFYIKWNDLTTSEQKKKGEVTVTIPGTNNAKLAGLVLDDIRVFYK